MDSAAQANDFQWDPDCQECSESLNRNGYFAHIEHWRQWTRRNETESAHKLDSGKPPMNLLSSVALLEVSKVLAHGAKKYESHQWRKGMCWSRLEAAAMRHITSWNDGEDVDPESGLSHLAHAMCCLMFLVEYQMLNLGTDDRWRSPGVPSGR